MIPDIIKQVGPQQYEALKNLMGEFGKKAGGKTEDDDEDDVSFFKPIIAGALIYDGIMRNNPAEAMIGGFLV